MNQNIVFGILLSVTLMLGACSGKSLAKKAAENKTVPSCCQNVPSRFGSAKKVEHEGNGFHSWWKFYDGRGQ